MFAAIGLSWVVAVGLAWIVICAAAYVIHVREERVSGARVEVDLLVRVPEGFSHEATGSCDIVTCAHGHRDRAYGWPDPRDLSREQEHVDGIVQMCRDGRCFSGPRFRRGPVSG